MSKYARKGTLVNRKFFHYLLPTILSNVAMSLNEFVDSIIVSQLLGADAMGMVNMGYPVMLTFAVIYTCLGVGGSVVYAEHAGKQEGEKAGRIFSVIIALTLVVSAILVTTGLHSIPQGSYDLRHPDNPDTDITDVYACLGKAGGRYGYQYHSQCRQSDYGLRIYPLVPDGP